MCSLEMEAKLTFQLAESNGQLGKHTVLRLPAFPIQTFLIETCLQATGEGQAPTVSVNVPCRLPYSPCTGGAPAPSIVPMTEMVEASTPSSPHCEGSWPYEPQGRHPVRKLIRRWQTGVTASAIRHDNSIFNFNIPGEFLAIPRCSVRVHAHMGALLAAPFGTNLPDQYCKIQMRPVGDPCQLMHLWPPSPIVQWRFQARYHDYSPPFLDLVLEFKLPGH